LKASAELKAVNVDAEIADVVVSENARKIAGSLASGRKVGILLGNFSQQHVDAAKLHQLAQRLGHLLGASFGFIGEAANSVGGYVANAIPGSGGLNARTMLEQPRKAYVVLGAEPDLDCANGMQAVSALKQAATVVMLSPFKSDAMLDYADVLLPVSPFTETSGSFVNTEGRVQSFHASTKPLGDSRPAWKVLRVLGNLLGLSGFEFTSSEGVRAEAIGANTEFVSGLNNGIGGISVASSSAASNQFERVADVPIHFADGLVRRAVSLQQTQDATAPVAGMNGKTLARLGIADGASVRVGAGGTPSIVLAARLDTGLPDNAVRIAAAHSLTAPLGAMTAILSVERA